ncbi:MAG: GTPase Era [Spirochaetales bacterium]|nr:GTPase Era [Spirochaetales bacterium]
MKSGFVAIVGRPSAGKSTLLNALCGEKVAITSAVPQTTRSAIRGIVNREEGQLVFLDTPGYHESEKKLNQYLKDVVHRSLQDADAVLYVIDATRPPGKEEKAIAQIVNRTKVPILVAANKTDLDPPALSEVRGFIRLHVPRLEENNLLNISAVNGLGVESLISMLLSACPEGEPHYPTDFYTDQDPEFRIAEIIREQAIARSEQEVPHALYVEIADMEFQAPPAQNPDSEENSQEKDVPNLPEGAPEGFFEDTPATTPARQTLWVRAFLTVERKSQVGILVGKGGAKIRDIRIGSLKEMKKVFPWKMRLDLRVKVNPKWRRKDMLLKRLTAPGE